MSRIVNFYLLCFDANHYFDNSVSMIIRSDTLLNEFEEEEDPKEEDDDMEVDIEEDENVPELTYPYEEMDPLNHPSPASELEPKDAIKVKILIKHEDETVPASVYEVGESSTAPFLREDSDGLLPGLIRRDINSLFGRMTFLSRRLCGREAMHALVEKKGKAKDEFYGKLILDLGNEVRSSVEQGTDAMERLVEKLGNAEGKVECKKLKKEIKEERCKIHVKYRSFHSIRAESPYDTKWPRWPKAKMDHPKAHLRPAPPIGYIYPLLALERVSSHLVYTFTYLYYFCKYFLCFNTTEIFSFTSWISGVNLYPTSCVFVKTTYPSIGIKSHGVVCLDLSVC
nr:hypothetical protein [Tanacetum cinerariifolium]